MNAHEAPRSLFGEPARPWAIFSPCKRYRYVLAWPTGLDDERYALFILANPSTATAEQTDPTIRRCIAYARRWGYGWARIVNVRAWRETNPKLVPADPEAIGRDNDLHIREQADASNRTVIVCGWGKLGGERGRWVLRMLRSYQMRPMALKLNDDGSPAHPLYQLANAELVEVPA